QAPPHSRVAQIWTFSGLSLKEIISRIVFLGMILMVLIISIVCLVLAIKFTDKPFAGFLLNERMVPGNVGRPHWTGRQGQLKYLDKILKVNDQPVSSMKDLEKV